MFLLAGPAVERQREGDVCADDGGAGQPPGGTGKYFYAGPLLIIITHCLAFK